MKKKTKKRNDRERRAFNREKERRKKQTEKKMSRVLAIEQTLLKGLLKIREVK